MTQQHRQIGTSLFPMQSRADDVCCTWSNKESKLGKLENTKRKKVVFMLFKSRFGLDQG